MKIINVWILSWVLFFYYKKHFLRAYSVPGQSHKKYVQYELMTQESLLGSK